ncbi:MAG: ABC transporter permease [Candidatus Aminicenantes bacterium]|nr:ABC transporter permease [Candidatus Aminicenantes bacterium]
MRAPSPEPPRTARRLAMRLSGYQKKYSFAGDLEEVFQEIAATRGRAQAARWYRRQCLAAIPAYLWFSLRWRLALAAQYLLVTVRGIRRHKVFSAVNIVGYAVGLAGALLIFLWIRDELAFDRGRPDAGRTYRMISDYPKADEFMRSPVTSAVLGPRLLESYPEIEALARLECEPRAVVNAGGESFIENQFFFVEANVFDMFAFPWRKGDPRTALSEPGTVVVSPRAALKYFGHDDPLGKILSVEGRGEFRVTGVVDGDAPRSHWRFDFAASFSSLGKIDNPWIHQGWTYVRLKAGTDPVGLDRKLADDASALFPYSQGISFSLQPLTDIHLRSRMIGEIEENGDARNISIFAVIAGLVILVAAFNFVNLSTARSAVRAREVGLRKVVGASRGQLIGQFLGEALTLSAAAFALALVLAGFFLPLFNRVADRSFGWGDLLAPSVFLPMLGIVAVAGLAAGSYPAFLVASFQPVEAFRRGDRRRPGKASLRQVLVIAQFAVSISLLSVTFIVGRQMSYVRSKALGYDTSSILRLPLDRSPLRKSTAAFKQEILKHPGILSAAAAMGSPLNGALVNTRELDGRRVEVHYLPVDPDYLRTMGIRLTAGRDFPPGISAASPGVILNETAVRLLRLDNPIGRTIPAVMGKDKPVVIGVAKDFHVKSLHAPIPPVIMEVQPSFFRSLLIRLAPGEQTAALAHLAAAWREFCPGVPFEYSFLSEQAEALYRAESRVGLLCAVFAGLAVFIAGLGLFGLASYAVERRTREIGIRRVLGARVTQVAWLTTGESLRLVAAANLLAWPAAYLASKKWLERFAYQTGIGVEIFLLSGAVALVIGVATVGLQSWRAAASNPGDALRVE